MRRLRYWLYQKLGLLEDYSPQEKGRELVFEDNFEQESWLVPGKWTIGEGYKPDSPWQYYVAPKQYGTYAVFWVKYNPKSFDGVTIPFEASLLHSQDYFRQQYGRFECRCTIPKEKGAWPAFWLWGPTWPPEIDIFEEIESRHNMNLIYGTGRKERVCQGMKVELGVFHEFALEWTPSKMDFFVDGVLVFRYKGKALKYYNDPIARMWLVINHGIHGEQKPDYYSEILVDYIRVYKGIY